jgi:hypothetical protein
MRIACEVRSIRSAVVGVSIITLLMGLTSCSDDSKTKSRDPVAGTPDEALDLLALSYEAKDLDTYTSMLHEDFRFGFVEDIADSLGLPAEEPWWGRTEDIASTGNMFGNSAVTDVSMFFISRDDWVPWPEERPDSTYTGLACRCTPDILVAIEETGREPLRLVVNESYLDIVVVRLPGRQERWVITTVTEIPKNPGRAAPACRATAATSWSEIKAIFSQQIP